MSCRLVIQVEMSNRDPDTDWNLGERSRLEIHIWELIMELAEITQSAEQRFQDQVLGDSGTQRTHRRGPWNHSLGQKVRPMANSSQLLSKWVSCIFTELVLF